MVGFGSCRGDDEEGWMGREGKCKKRQEIERGNDASPSKHKTNKKQNKQ